MDTRQFYDKNFPNLTVKSFIAKEHHLAEETVFNELCKTLSADEKKEVNEKHFEKILSSKINASGAIILMVNTNDGLKLVYANSQRRQKVVSTNGACESGESLIETALREFSEELGNPGKKSFLKNMVEDSSNHYSIKMMNGIGKNLKEIALRILNNKNLYINLSLLCINKNSIHIQMLEQEIKNITAKLEKSAMYYQQAAKIRYNPNWKMYLTTKNNPEMERDAIKIINEFKMNCKENITSKLILDFDKLNSGINPQSIDKALKGIIDLAENNKVAYMSKRELQTFLSLNFKKWDEATKFLKDNDIFTPSFENILLHKGSESADAFLLRLEKAASKVDQITLGCVSSSIENQSKEEALQSEEKFICRV